MFGIQTSELLVIALVAILLFGPERVPEFFHRAGQIMSRLQRSADDLWTSIQIEMNQTTKPLEDLGREIKTFGDTIKRPLGSGDSGKQAGEVGSDGETSGDQTAEDDRDEPPEPDPT